MPVPDRERVVRLLPARGPAPAAFPPGAAIGIIRARPGGRERGSRAGRCNGGAGRGHLHRKGRRIVLLDGGNVPAPKTTNLGRKKRKRRQ
jgi:hypothetical protein